ncbi:decaprenyl-phosphate phosphoribosyltransferase [bacterium]|nr:decaprenyl-phosphate phosphoribosyltransferase [bacterium]
MTTFARHVYVSVRPKHWVKNLLVLAPLVFAQELGSPLPLLKSAAAFIVFCLLASASYLFNDVIDAVGDRVHPLKGTRPIAMRELGGTSAVGVALILTAVGLWVAFALDRTFGFVAAAFVATHVLYSTILTRIVIVDVFTLAANYVLRVVAGAVVIDVPMSPWLLICTMLLSLFLGLSARSLDFKLLGEEAARHRSSLAHYNPYLLDQMIAVITSAILIAYTLYTISPETVAKFGTNKLALTAPFVLYGIFRYLYLIHQGEAQMSIERALFSDLPMRINAFLYALATVAIIYL